MVDDEYEADDRRRAARWGDLLIASPYRIFFAVLLVSLVVETGQGALRALVLPDLSGVAGVAVDLLWLPTLLGVLLWRVVVKPLHHRLADEVEDIRDAEAELRDRTDRLVFDGQLRRATETVDEETGVLKVVDRAAAQAAPALRTRLLLAGDDGDLSEVAGHTPADGPGCCALARTEQCPAIRSGQPMTFPSTAPLDACPVLLEADVPAGAACHPVTVLGETRGVLTTTFPENEVPDDASHAKLESIAARTGSRLSLVRALEDSRRQATTDPLTRLVNRRALRAAFGQARHDGTPSLLLCDLDHFKQLNDTHGHDVGDVALVDFADVLRRATRLDDVAARIGGEEFAILLPGTSLDEAAVVAERIRRDQAASAASGRPTTTTSIGVASSGEGDLEDLLRAADEALYTAKEAGRDAVALRRDDGVVVLGTADGGDPSGEDDVDGGVRRLHG